MVRSLTQWTKTLSFPARISPNKSSKDSVNIHQISPALTPTLSNNSLSKTNEKNTDINNLMNSNSKHNSLNEVNQVSVFLVFILRKFRYLSTKMPTNTFVEFSNINVTCFFYFIPLLFRFICLIRFF